MKRTKIPLQRVARRVVAVGVVAYALAVFATWALLHFGGDRWWFATVMLFAPRWLYALPLIALVPWIPLVGLRVYWPILPALAVLVVPIMGLCIPWQAWLAGSAGGSTEDVSLGSIRLLCANVHGARSDPAVLRALMAEHRPDVVALQEYRGWETERLEDLFSAGWNVERAGQLVIASRWPILSTERRRGVKGFYCVIDTPTGPVGVANFHFTTPRWGLQEVLDRRMLINPRRSAGLRESIAKRREESQRAAQWLRNFDEPRIIAGDLNMPVDSAIYREVWADYGNAFCQAGFGFGGTKRTEVHNPVRDFEYGLRIDHVLFDGNWRPRGAWLGPDIGSTHLPLLAQLENRAKTGQASQPSGYVEGTLPIFLITLAAVWITAVLCLASVYAVIHSKGSWRPDLNSPVSMSPAEAARRQLLNAWVVPAWLLPGVAIMWAGIWLGPAVTVNVVDHAVDDPMDAKPRPDMEATDSITVLRPSQPHHPPPSSSDESARAEDENTEQVYRAATGRSNEPDPESHLWDLLLEGDVNDWRAASEEEQLEACTLAVSWFWRDELPEEPEKWGQRYRDQLDRWYRDQAEMAGDIKIRDALPIVHGIIVSEGITEEEL